VSKKILNFFLSNLLLLGLFAAVSVHAAGRDQDIPEASKLVRLGIQSWQHEGQDYLVVNYINYPHWHTYWKNPGDAGLPLKTKFTINGQPAPLEGLEWPAPKLYVEEGGIIAYGYGDTYSLFFRLPKNYTQNSNFSLKANWLICKHVCIPGEKTLSGSINNGKITSNSEVDLPANETLKRFQSLPREYAKNDLDIILSKSSDKDKPLSVYYQFNGTKASTKLGSHFMITPFPKEPFDFHKETLVKDSDSLIGKLKVAWDGEYMEPEEKLPANGVFKDEKTLQFLFFHPDEKKTYVVTKKFKKFLMDGENKFETFFGGVKKNSKEITDTKQESKSTPAKPKESLLFILLFAFLGGMILNVMPCVLPVISIKLFGLIKSSQTTRQEIFRHNIFYSLGVLASFWVLAGVILLLKNSGESLGWGFQLQSPTFVAIVILILFIFALNLFGLFEFRLPGASKLGGVQVKEGAAGDFFNGVLATVLSTPCSAPFLGAALTYAFASSGIVTFTVFTFMGLGLASPFIVIALFPSTIKWLPKPGMWMDHLKKFLGLALLLTIVWLFDVFSALVDGSDAIIWFNTTLVFAFFWIYFSNRIAERRIFKILAMIPVIFFLYKTTASFNNEVLNTMGTASAVTKNKEHKYGLSWEKWSKEKMQEHKGKWVFMDFTAKWCFTCKVNEKVVINTDEFRKIVNDKNAEMLLGDWTKKDPRITDFLKENGLVGVPAYFIQTPDGKLINLGETITLNKIKENFGN
jgi:thiol:disulfide interchange protein/DsbC/DsbD-like thiol-disulfide interchange protein